MDVNSQDHKGKTPIMYAVTKGEDEIVELLLAHGASLEKSRRAQATPVASEERKKSLSLFLFTRIIALSNAEDQERSKPP